MTQELFIHNPQEFSSHILFSEYKIPCFFSCDPLRLVIVDLGQALVLKSKANFCTLCIWETSGPQKQPNTRILPNTGVHFRRWLLYPSGSFLLGSLKEREEGKGGKANSREWEKLSHEYGRVSAFIEWIHTCERMEGRVVYISISKLKDILLTVFKNLPLPPYSKLYFQKRGKNWLPETSDIRILRTEK